MGVCLVLACRFKRSGCEPNTRAFFLPDRTGPKSARAGWLTQQVLGACANPSSRLPRACVQVQLLYDLAAQNSRGRRGRGSSRDEEGVAAPETKQAALLAASEDTTRALTRLAEQASAKMSLAASKTEFKEAALWRDRRDALLDTVRLLEPESEREAAVA